MSVTAQSNKARAKVYCLNEEGQWDDQGTGHARIMHLQVLFLQS